MAGIGFRLQKLLSGDDYTSTVKAFAFSALITAGPFLLTIVLVVLVHALARDSLAERGLVYLQALITYGFALSLACVGPSSLVLTRYVADQYYRGDTSSFVASFFSAYLLNLAVFSPLALWFFGALGVGWGLRVDAYALFVVALGTWLAMIFLSAARDYWTVTRGFVIGLAVSLPASLALGRVVGLQGYFAGFLLGQAATLVQLIGAMLGEFGYREPRDHHWLAYFRAHPRLAVIGLLYNLGIWADKALFWLGPEGERLDARLRRSAIYDTPMFVGYLTVLPALVFFFLLVETDFFLKYRDYFQAIQRQEGLDGLEKRRLAIVRSLRSSFRRVATAQGVCTALAVLGAPWLIQAARMNPMHMSVLRLGIYGAMLQTAALIVMNVLLYFDHQSEALTVVAVFCAANVAFTALTLKLGLFAYGYGYVAASLATLGVGLYLLNERLRLLHYWTFSRQPFPAPVAAHEEAEPL